MADAPWPRRRAVFVTGASGFLGRALLRRLHADGAADVRVMVRSARAAAACAAACSSARAVWASLDDVDDMAAGMAGCDVVFHCAADVRDVAPRAEAWHANVVGTINVLAAARRVNVRRVVHVSTDAVLSDGRPLVNADETTPLSARPAGIYTETKAAAEREVASAVAAGQDVVVVRPRFVWGPDDTTLLPIFVAAAKAGSWLWVDGGRTLTSTVYIDNCVEGMVLAALRGAPGGVYFLADAGPPRMLRDVATALVRTQGLELPASAASVPSWLVWAVATVDACVAAACCRRAPLLSWQALALVIVDVTVSDARARRELGYVGRVSVAEGLERMRVAAAAAAAAAAAGGGAQRADSPPAAVVAPASGHGKGTRRRKNG